MLKPYLVLDSGDRDVPAPVLNEMRDMWAEKELGNDDYYVPVTVAELEEEDEYPVIQTYLITQGVSRDQVVLIHFWW